MVFATLQAFNKTLGPSWSLPPDLITQLTTAASLTLVSIALLWISLRKAARLTGGNSREGLGLTALQRPGLLAIIISLTAIAAFLWLALLNHFNLLTPHTTQTNTLSHALPLPTAMLILDVAILTPVAEECFFRGWLWTALARRWPVWGVSVACSSMWLLAHIGEGYMKPTALLPQAIALAIVRHKCGGIRGGIVLHVVNNLIYLSLLLLG